MLRSDKPNPIDITFEELNSIIKIVEGRLRNKILVARSIDNVKSIFILYGVECPEFDHNDPLNIKIPPGEEDAYEQFRNNLILDLIKNFPIITNQIKIIKIEYGDVKRWIFSPACEYVNKKHVQDSDGIVKYCHIKHNIYLRTTINYGSDLLFDYHQKAFSVIETIYYFIIINHFELCEDIRTIIKKKALSF